MTMTKREKMLISIVLVLAVLCVYFIYFLQPNLKEIDALKSEMDLKGFDVTTNDQMQLRIQTIDKQMEEDESRLLGYGKGITAGFDQPPILCYLKDTVARYANKISFAFSGVSPLGQLQVCPVTVTMTATYEGLKSVLDALDSGKYLVKVTGLSAAYHNSEQTSAPGDQEAPPVPSAPEQRILDIILNLEFYSYPGEIPPDTEYPFVPENARYGGDIFF